MISQRKTIEDAIVERLKRLYPNVLAHVAPYRGQLKEDAGSIKEAMLGKFPAALVTTSSARYHGESTGKKRVRKDLTIEIIVANWSQRSTLETARNDVPGAGEGAQYAMEQIMGWLIGSKVRAGTLNLTLNPVAEEPLLDQPDLSIWKLTLTCGVDQLALEVPVGQFDEIAGKHNLTGGDDEADNPVITTITSVGAEA